MIPKPNQQKKIQKQNYFESKRYYLSAFILLLPLFLQWLFHFIKFITFIGY